jgi:hypothetical protein
MNSSRFCFSVQTARASAALPAGNRALAGDSVPFVHRQWRAAHGQFSAIERGAASGRFGIGAATGNPSVG